MDVSNWKDLEFTACRINRSIEKFNEQGTKPYQLSFSMGYAVYDYQSHMKVKEFQEHLDLLMYENKRKRLNESESKGTA